STGARWSPNGLTLAYVQWDVSGQNSEIVVVTLQPVGFGTGGLTISEKRVLTSDGGRKRDITWFSDGSRLAYVNSSEGVDGLYVVGVAVPIFQNLVQGPFHLHSPAFLTGGMTLAYVSDENGVDSVFALNGKFMGDDAVLPLAIFATGQPLLSLIRLDSHTVLVELGPRATSRLGVLDLNTTGLTTIGGPGPNLDADFFREPPSTV
ncbi:MAG: PD40 domain-containing protein, partial [Deinococcus sp.]|nr:PD40 domain-containing protein [Deinococcus sp.]